MKQYFILMIAASLLLFGCLAPPAQPAGTTTPTTAPAAAPSAPANGTPSGTTAPTQPSGTGTSGTTPQDFTGLDYLALTALGVPVECDISVTSAGQTYTSKMFLKGTDTVRLESSGMTAGGCTKMVMISKAKKTYMDLACLKSSGLIGTCDWLVMDDTTSGTSTPSPGTSTSTMSMGELTDMPAASFTCKAWVYDSSKFNTPGKVCTQQEYEQDVMSALNLSVS